MGRGESPWYSHGGRACGLETAVEESVGEAFGVVVCPRGGGTDAGDRREGSVSKVEMD
jgi:hypothetical protein